MNQQRRMKQKVFATGDSRCPVKFIEQLISKRPSQLNANAQFESDGALADL